MKSRRNVWLIITGFTLAVICLAFFGMIAVWIAQKLGFASSPVEQGNLRLFVQVPPIAEVGNTFDVMLTIENTSDDFLHVDEISLSKELLDGAVVVAIFPGTLQQKHYEHATGYQIDYLLAPKTRQEFKLALLPRSVMDVMGELGVNAGAEQAKAGVHMEFLQPATLTPTLTSTSTATLTPTQTPVPPTATPTAVPIPYQAVVKIAAKAFIGGRSRITWSGSGTLISPEGLILTNAHLASPDNWTKIRSLTIYMTKSPEQPPTARYLAELVDVDRDLDVALIRITQNLQEVPIDTGKLDLPFVPLGDSDEVQLGDPLIILGYPGIGGDTITFLKGAVGGFTMRKRENVMTFIKTTAPLTGGSSGGLALDQNGRIVAIPSQLGYGGISNFVDCQVIADTNRDGVIDNLDPCVPVGGYVNALRPVNLAKPMIEEALQRLEPTTKPTSTATKTNR